MDKLADHLNSLLSLHDNIKDSMQQEYKTTTERLERILFPDSSSETAQAKNGDLTPQQIKKRSKRLTAVSETEEEENVAPNQNSSKVSSNDSRTNSKRPPRAAKKNLDLKEKSINIKLRQPSESDKTLDLTTSVIIKKEKKSMTVNKLQKNATGSKESLHNGIEPMEVEINEANNNKSDDSVVFVTKQNNVIVVEIDSDNEMEKMPPPPAPLSKKRNIRKKKSEETIEMDLSKPTKIEKNVSLSSQDTTNSISQKEETESTLHSGKSAGHKKKRGRKPLPKPIIIKEERKSSPIKQKEESIPINQEGDKGNTSFVRQKENSKSLESVYEDAMPNPPLPINTNCENSPQLDTKTVNELANEKTPNISAPPPCLENSEKATDATFVSAKDLTVTKSIAIAMADATFTSNATFNNPAATAGQTTFVVNDINPNETVTIIKQIDGAEAGSNSNETFDIKSTKNTESSHIFQNATFRRASIMTEDNSQDESIVEEIKIPQPKCNTKTSSQINKNKKELFNPFIQSPLKQKIEAFEKAAAGSNSPLPAQRQTRTKTRAKQENQQSKENSDSENKNQVTKVITPNIGRHMGRLLTPNFSNITPTISGAVKKLPNSTSKIIGLTKALTGSKSSITSSSSSRTQSRENSSEDLKRGYAKFQEIAEERKKKRELKQQQAQQMREIKEKERAERFKRLMEDRENKAQRKNKEAEQKRQLEEINRNIKMQEEKREQQRKLEKQKQNQRQMAEAERKEREMLEAIKIQKAKEQLQYQLQKNQKHLQQSKAIKIVAKQTYHFDMIQTDDSTDDEEKESKRPPAPSWSKGSNLARAIEKQSDVPTDIMDTFFSVKPMTPDLKEIFPAIDAKHLKRNSSIYWSTPPRYSQLPKY